ncbi:MAG TPA: EamA family transporter [Candidatus Limnocylindrales bacterium]|nr:EamA family transporter [Candidatus Limnocylindrales bacterium]
MGILLGLMAAVGWGVADFSARFASRRVGAYRTLFFMQLFGFVVMTAYLEFTGGITRGVAAGWQPWAFAAFAGLINTLSSLSLYYSFQIGVMSIVAPISSSYPALTVALALLSGERLKPLGAAGLAVTFIGVILAATAFGSGKPAFSASVPAPSRAHLAKGVGWSIAAAVGFGFLFWFLGFHVIPLTGSAVSVWMIRVTSFSTLGLVAAPVRQSLRLPRDRVWGFLAIVGLADTLAFLANNAGLRSGQVSLVSVLASLYGAVTVLLSWIFLRERLERSQWFGIALIFTGIILVSL